MSFEQLGPYTIIRRLGRGGMGTVYEAIDTRLGRAAAVKILSTNFSDDGGSRDRFRAEIESLKQIRHPHIVELYGHGEQGGHPYYAMELVEGESLHDELRRVKRLGWQEAVRVARDLSSALRHAHDRGIIHRDIKPANILRARDGSIKLSDFGIAKLFGNQKITAEGGLLGTGEYMSPEQAMGRPSLYRGDLYSLGCVLYAMLSGKPPFQAESLPELLQKQCFAQARPLAGLVSNVPEELCRVVHQLLAKTPEERIPTALALERQLQELLGESSAAPLQKGSAIQLPEGSGECDRLLPLSSHEANHKPGEEARQEASLVKEPAAPAKDKDDELTRDDAPASAREEALVKGSTGGRAVGTPAPPQVKRGSGSEGRGRKENHAPATMISKTQPGAYTYVDRKQESETAREPERREPWFGIQTFFLAIALIALGVTGWYALQPPSADRLFERISAEIRIDDPESIVQVEEELQEFAQRYPKDPRLVKVNEHLEELELLRLERKLQRLATNGIERQAVVPIERIYIEALRESRGNPELERKKYQALIDLYQDDYAAVGTSRLCLKLARRKLERLTREHEQQEREESSEILRSLEVRMETAEELRAANLDGARRIWESIVTLYGDKNWAKEIVDQARRKLTENAHEKR